MKIDIYRSYPDSKNYLLVPHGQETSNLPEEVLNQFQGLYFVKTRDMQPGEERILLNTDEALQNMETKGYHIEKNPLTDEKYLKRGLFRFF